MRKKYVALGVGERGTTLVMEAIGAPRPRGFVPEVLLSDLAGKGRDLASDWIGEIVLRYLMAHHAATFAPYLSLRPPPAVRATTASPDAVVALRRTLEGVMHPHIEYGVADQGDAVNHRSVNASGGQEGFAPDMELFRLNWLGYDHAVGFVGGCVLRGLAFDHPAVFALYPELVAPLDPEMSKFFDL